MDITLEVSATKRPSGSQLPGLYTENFRAIYNFIVTGNGGTAPPTPPTPTPVPTPPTPTPATPTPTPPTPPTPTPPPPTPPTGACVHEKDCNVSPWCADTGFEEWCRQQGLFGQCPAPYCSRPEWWLSFVVDLGRSLTS